MFEGRFIVESKYNGTFFVGVFDETAIILDCEISSLQSDRLNERKSSFGREELDALCAHFGAEANRRGISKEYASSLAEIQRVLFVLQSFCDEDTEICFEFWD